MEIGEKIKQRRKELHISIDELAERLGKGRATLYRYENGEIKNIPIDILNPLAKELDVPVEYFLTPGRERDLLCDTEVDSIVMEAEDNTLSNMVALINWYKSLDAEKRKGLMEYIHHTTQ